MLAALPARGGPRSVVAMAEQDILTHIKELVAAEHELRAQEAAKQIDPDDARRQLAELEVTLDQ